MACSMSSVQATQQQARFFFDRPTDCGHACGIVVWVLLLLPQEWDVQQLCYEVDVEPYARTRDAAINQLAASAGVQVSAHVSHTLYVSDSTVFVGLRVALFPVRMRDGCGHNQ